MAYQKTQWTDHIEGVQEGTPVNAANMNKIEDAVNGLDSSKAQPNGIATLDGSGKLAQMPTAADVGAVPVSRTVNGKALSNNISLSAADVEAIKLGWSSIIDEAKAVPNKYNFNDYVTNGDAVAVANYAAAQSVANIPEAAPGRLYVVQLWANSLGDSNLMQVYITATGNVWCRPKYRENENWSSWSSNAEVYRRIQCGDVPVTMTSEDSGIFEGTANVSFTTPFKRAPIVSLTVRTTAPFSVMASLNSPPTANGFVIAVSAVNFKIGDRVNVQWIAVEQQ